MLAVPRIIFFSRNSTMVLKGHCRDPFTAATEACRRRKRGGKGRTITCFSPWSVVSCWFHLGRWRGGINLDELCSEDAENKIALGSLDPESSNSAMEVSVSAGGRGKEDSFSLGVGLGLIYLMATNKSEISQLGEMCKQMETMLHNFRREFVSGEGNDANISASYSTPKGQVFSNYPMDHACVQDCSSYSWEQENLGSDFPSSSYQNSHSKLKRGGKRLNVNRKGKRLDMDQLHAELEAELEHLQLNLDDEVLLSYSNQKNSEIWVEESAPAGEPMSASFEEAIERLEVENRKQQGVQPGEQIMQAVGEESAPAGEARSASFEEAVERQEVENRKQQGVQPGEQIKQAVGEESAPAGEAMSASFEEANEMLEMETRKHQGVHPRELEKRLLQLQEARQQERIRELELALGNAMRNMDENQKELSWWKDTARIVFQHSPQKTNNNILD